jgi:predicted nucleic acid-binding protein
MIVIADSNIVFDALISPNGKVAKILNGKSKAQFVAPDYLLNELMEHSPILIEIMCCDKVEFEFKLAFAIKNIKFISMQQIPNKLKIKSILLVKDIDIDDAPFVAMHFFTGYKIWTLNKKLSHSLANSGHQIFVHIEDVA